MRLRDLLETVGATATVVTAGRSPDQVVRWVHITDLPDPSPYLRGGEFVLTNGLWYREPADADRFVDAVADAGAPVIGYPVYEDLAYPHELARACERRGVTFLLLPDIPFRDIAEHVMTSIVEERQAARMHGGSLAKELGRRLADGGDVDALLDVLAREARAPAALLLRDGTSLGGDLGGRDRRRLIWEQMFASSMPRDSLFELSLPGGRATVGAVAHRAAPDRPDEVSAVLVFDAGMAALHGHLDTLYWIAAGYLPRTGAIERGERRERAVSELLEALGGGRLGEAEPAARLEDLGFAHRAEGDAALAVLVADGPQPVAPDALAGAIRVGLDGAETIAGALDGRAVALVSSAGGDAEAIAAAASAQLAKLSPAASLGAASHRGAALDHRRLLAQAVNALRVAERSAERRWATARQAGSHRLLLGTADPTVLENLRLTTLDPLIRYDERHGTDLVRTLRVYLDACGAWQRAADQLRLHVNSLRYRIGRIEQLTGRDIGAMADRVDFFLALRSLEHPASGAEGQ